MSPVLFFMAFAFLIAGSISKKYIDEGPKAVKFRTAMGFMFFLFMFLAFVVPHF